MKIRITIISAILLLTACTAKVPYGETVSLDNATLMDKIKGGWYGQTIGCTYGIYDTYIEDPGLYDDVYMDLTFMETMLKEGLDAPVDSYAKAFAYADYKLWHANQAARYNILNGRGAPESGHWKYNPHADDIDFQIEADFIGMLYPGQVNKASELSDRIGHIMNYGDGWYGGVFIGAMYCLAYVCDDIPTIVSEALKTIPEGTKFHSTISDCIKFWKKYPLYGEGDFLKTMDISTRCGNDSDCNPASAAGILGVMYGYDAIPDYWKKGAERIKDIPFPYTSLSLDQVCQENYNLILQCNEPGDNGILFNVEKPQPVRYEQCFEGIKPVEKRVLKKAFTTKADFSFKGNSIVVEGSVRKTGHADDSYVASVTALLDGTELETFTMPVDYITRKYEIFSAYCFDSGEHTLTLRLNNPHPDFELYASEMVVYDSL